MCAVRDLQRLSPRVLAGRAAAAVSADARACLRPSGRRQCWCTYVTAASQEMADLLAHVLAFDGGLGSRSEVVEGRYTGRAAGPVQLSRGQGASRCTSWPGARGSISPPPMPTRTPSPTCRCYVRFGNPVVVNPDTEICAASPIAKRVGRCCTLIASGRRLKVLAAVGGVTALGGLGRVVSEHVGARAEPRALQFRASGLPPRVESPSTRAPLNVARGRASPADPSTLQSLPSSFRSCQTRAKTETDVLRHRPAPGARSASSWPSPASTATTAARRSSPGPSATRAWR